MRQRSSVDRVKIISESSYVFTFESRVAYTIKKIYNLKLNKRGLWPNPFILRGSL